MSASASSTAASSAPSGTGPWPSPLISVLIPVRNPYQLDHVMQVLEEDGKVESFRAALKKTIIASIGPTASERLRHFDLPIDFEPSHPKMGILVKETGEQAHKLLEMKR